MRSIKLSLPVSLLISGFAGAALTLGIAGCSSSKPTLHPDEQGNVNTALRNNNLTNVVATQNRVSGIMNLTGTVPTQELKDQATQIAETNAPGYKVSNIVDVVPPSPEEQAATANTALESAFKDKIADNKALSDLEVKADNGDLALSGTVRSIHDRDEALRIARKLPGIKHVTDHIRIHR